VTLLIRVRITASYGVHTTQLKSIFPQTPLSKRKRPLDNSYHPTFYTASNSCIEEIPPIFSEFRSLHANCPHYLAGKYLHFPQIIL